MILLFVTQVNCVTRLVMTFDYLFVKFSINVCVQYEHRYNAINFKLLR